MAKPYWEKLKDPRWQKKRLEALQSAEFACEVCYDSESTLHVHHKQYFKGREPWEYDAKQLAVLCESCHASHHEAEDALNLVYSYLPMDGPYARETVASLVAGYANLECPKEVAYYAGVLADNVFAVYSRELKDLAELAGLSKKDSDGMFDALLRYAAAKTNGVAE